MEKVLSTIHINNEYGICSEPVPRLKSMETEMNTELWEGDADWW